MIRRGGLFVLALVLGLGAGLRDQFDRWVATTDLPVVLYETSVEMYGSDGRLMRAFPVEGGRMRLALGSVQPDPAFIEMLVAYEDKRFYRHKGVDPWAMLRAAGQALTHGEVVSGGSTLTMQVARLLENSGTGHLAGKLRQIRLALALEQHLTKREILDLYFLHAPYGGPLEGIRAASLAWFGKEPTRLTPSEAALLVALPQSPETRRPDRYPDRARLARDRVLERVGQSAVREVVPAKMRPFPRHAPHLADHLRAQYAGVRRFDVTLDDRLQRLMQGLARQVVAGQPSGVSVAIVVADHTSGEVRASVGSARYSDANGALGYVDMTRAVRSPGSTLKPLIYALAFDEGLVHPETLINDAPVAFGLYAPQNFDGIYRGELTVRKALQLSLNIPPVLLMDELGPATLLARLRRAGTNPKLAGDTPGLAVALGGVGLTLNGLVQLYAGIANGGMARPLIWHREEEAGTPRRVVSAKAAWQVGHILNGLAPPAGVAAQNGEIAYKTGTSYGHRDAWAIGFDGRHVVGVWLGRPDGTPVPGVFGGELAAPVLFEAFGRIDAMRTPLPPPPHDTLLVSTSELPEPLQRFRSRKAAFAEAPDQPVVTFPPDGAVLRGDASQIPLKVRHGVPPFTVILDGKPVLTGLRRRDAMLDLQGPGFSSIAVIDARGRAAQVQIRLD